MGKRVRTATSRPAATTPAPDATPDAGAPSDLERQILGQAPVEQDAPPPPPPAAPVASRPSRSRARGAQAPTVDVKPEPAQRPRGGGFSVRHLVIRNKHTKQVREFLCPIHPPSAYEGALKPGDEVTNGGGKGEEKSYPTEAERDEALGAFGWGVIDPLAKNEVGPAIPHT